MEDDVNMFSGEKNSRKKKRKLELEKDEKKSEKAGKKHKKDKVGDDFGVREEASEGTGVDGEENFSLESKDKKKEEKKKKKYKKKEEAGEDDFGVEEASVAITTSLENKDRKKKKKKAESGEDDKKKEEVDVVEGIDAFGVDNMEADKHQKKKKKKKKNKDEIGSSNATDDGSEEAKKDKKKKKKKKKKKIAESIGDDLEDQAHKEGVEATNQSGNPSSKGKSKKVSFADRVEVFPLSGDKNETNENKKPELVRGKRFTIEEDAILKEAVLKYIEMHGLGEEGLDKVLYSKSHPEVKNCWKEIGAALPQRHTSSVYHRAHILFERDEKRKWTEEEYEVIRKHVEKNGHQWKPVAGALGKHRQHVKDAWRRRKLENRKRGQWSQEEYQTLFDLVNLDLCMKATEEKKSKHGMLRDNICWGAISDRMSTRAFAACCSQWYYKLASPMVAEGKWADADDYRMLDALSSLDACCMEDVDWDNLLEHRSGDICRKRWSQMVQHIGHHGSQSFPEQVETLSNRYRPDMVEARETFDAKPYADGPE